MSFYIKITNFNILSKHFVLACYLTYFKSILFPQIYVFLPTFVFTQISLFFDLLLPLCSSVKESNFVSGSRSGAYGRHVEAGGDTNRSPALTARELLWKELQGFKSGVGKYMT